MGTSHNKAHTALVKAALEYLYLRGAVCSGNNTGMLYNAQGRPVRYGCVGSADIIGVLPGGRFFGAEAKTGRGVLTDNQKNWHDAINEVGGIAITFRELEDLDVLFTKEVARETTGS